MFEEFLIGFLFGVIATLPIFPPNKNSVWSWIWTTIHKRRTEQ
jgi:hypothetical protein